MRLATAEDNAGLCNIFRNVKMESNLTISEEREPNFFSLRALHSGKSFTLVIEDTDEALSDEDRIAGCCTAVVREGWLNGSIKKVGYICDLRVTGKFRKGRVFPQGIDLFINYLMQRERVDAFYFSMMRANYSAQYACKLANALPMTAYNMVNIQLLRNQLPVQTLVEKGCQKNKSELINFISRQAKKRTFGFNFDVKMFEHRLQHWPDFALSDFFILRNSSGNIVACAAPWDTAKSIRRSRVHGYRGSMKLIRAGIDLEAKLRGHSPMPQPGECFNIVSLTHFEVEDNNPVYLNRLLRGIYNHYAGGPYHFIALFVPENSPLENGLKGFRTQKVPMNLYSFIRQPSSIDEKDCVTQQPGFEMALH